MVRNFLAGGAAVSVMSRMLGVRQIVADAGIAADSLPDHPDLRSVRAGRGTGDISRGPAMSPEQRSAEARREPRRRGGDAGADLIATGDMGIGNTTAASAITAVMTGASPEHSTGPGTGRTPEELRRKVAVVRRALEHNAPDPAIRSACWRSALLVAALAALTRRALHLDGFMDTCDALLGGFDRERRLEILRDPHVGAFAVVGVVCLLLVKLAALTDRAAGGEPDGHPDPSFPYARREGLGTPFVSRSSRFGPWAGLLIAAAAAVALTGLPGLALAALAAAVAWAGGAWATRQLGGVTGDIYGAVNETAEVAVLGLAVLVLG
ncbi:Nicotinate-nucleotide--dimethylbenzimidazole phosphoribosyltransferase [Geodia barretti]|uniref:Nicotinate-nucleotide--dimethylbenzimidazole phosphoribosyltransferase n=1 Tax=Geodia barretti TaxID=519541 RepID=A0AA35XHV2_GEOBA|nr:Nicotinate-nucleotide--dimethylbenzimidazole phosphoribosyltransferase [Geodia barretti]